MEIKLKLKDIAVLGTTLVALGISGANIYNSHIFNRNMNEIKENYGSFGPTGDRLIYARNYIYDNNDFPNNILTFLPRTEAEEFIEEAKKYPFTLRYR